MSAQRDWLDDEIKNRRVGQGENRLPPALAVVVAGAVYALLPESLLFTPRLVIPAAEALLLMALLVANPRRMIRQTRWSRIVSAALTALIIVANFVALGMLVASLTNRSTPGSGLLVAAMQVWVTNVIGFALLYWELDRGGPVTRREERRDKLPPADWRFSQGEKDDTLTQGAVGLRQTPRWVPLFLDHLYPSPPHSHALSPPPTQP